MADIPDHIYDIWLAQILGIASPLVSSIFRYFHSAEEVYNGLPESIDNIEIPNVKKQEMLKKDLLEATEIYNYCKEKNYYIISHTDDLYPNNLKNIEDYPIVLYGSGDISALEDSVFISMVGPREPSQYGVLVAGLLAYDLAVAGFTVVSGLARGIDSYCHQECIRGKGKTIAFVGNGLDNLYPSSNKKLRSIIEKRGLVLSEIPPKINGNRNYFPIRNRLISGISEAVVLVEGGRQSGSLITAKHALEQNRDVFVSISSIFDSRFEGVFSFLKEGAYPILSALDIVMHYLDKYPDKLRSDNVRPNFYSKNFQKNPPILPRNKIEPKVKEASPIIDKENLNSRVVNELDNKQNKNNYSEEELNNILKDLDEETKMVYFLFDENPIHINELQQKSKLNMQNILVILTELELFSLVESKPGKVYLKL